MAKYKVTLPNIDDSCKDGNCTHKHVHELSNEPEQPKVELIQQQQPQIGYTPSPNQIQMQVPSPQQHTHEEKPKTTELSHDEMIELMPKSVNFAKCKGDNCGKPLKNKNPTKKFKKCTNCNDNGVPNGSSYCPTCGKTEPTDADELEDYWEESEIDTEVLEKMLDDE